MSTCRRDIAANQGERDEDDTPSLTFERVRHLARVERGEMTVDEEKAQLSRIDRMKGARS